MLKRMLPFGLIGALLGACSGPPVVAMQNPQTGGLQDCKTAGYYSYLFEADSATGCAAKMEADGWRRWHPG